MQVTWDKARHTCRCQYGGDLLSVTSSEESQWVVANPLTAGTGNSWIGLSDFAVEGEFKWEDGTSFSWTNWLSGQPSDSSDTSTMQDCVVMRQSDGAWADNDCDTTKEFLCQAGEKGSTTSTVAASPACTCETDWVGNIDTGKCYRGYTDKLENSEAVTACKVGGRDQPLTDVSLFFSGCWR